MANTEGTAETRKLDQHRPPSMDVGVNGGNSKEATNFRLERPPHAPYSKSIYPGQYAGYPGATRPPQPRLQSVVTSSFSAEDERDPSHRGSFPPIPRHVNVNTSHAEQHHWTTPAEERYPSEGPESNAREMGQEGRQQPPSGDENPIVVPPSPARGGPQQGGYPPLLRGSGTGSFMGPPEPLKRSFWHHSRPDDEFASSSLPPDFLPPKRAKLTPRGEAMPTRSPNHGTDIRDLRRPPSFFHRAFSWESRDEQPYYHGLPPSGPSPRESPRYAPEHGRVPLPHPSPSPPPQYRDCDYNRCPPRYAYLPPHDNYHRHGSPSSTAAAAAAAAANHYQVGRWMPHHDHWGQPPTPSPNSGSRRSPTFYHQPPSMSPSYHFRDDSESNHGWSNSRDRDLMHDTPGRLPQFDDSPYRLNSPYARAMPPLQKQPPCLPPLNHARNTKHGETFDNAGYSMSNNSRVDPPEQIIVANGGYAETSKEGPLLLLALPQDRISLSETLCVVREVSCVPIFLVH